MGKLYVGNLPFKATEEEVTEHFSSIGAVTSVKIITDRDTGRAKGFGFVEMENSDAAVAELDGKDFQGRNLKVNVAIEKPRGERKEGGYPSYPERRPARESSREESYRR